MNCAMAVRMLDAHLDNEVDAATAADVASHLAGCGACAAAHEARVALRTAIHGAGLRQAAPEGLRESVMRAVRAQSAKRIPSRVAQWWHALALAGCAAVAGLIGGWWLAQPQILEDLPAVVVAHHVASLTPSGPRVEVASSDRHVVRPWFQGRAEFAPTVRDLSDQGFELLGARRDSIRGREAVAVVYRLRGHFITVYSWRRSDGAHSELDTTVRGFNVVQWSDRDIDYAVVSDVDGAELKKLVAAIRG
jgi:anti-sigma factor RsiW